ncbi:MAG TPA: hemolysin III family protein [Polyangia bacterium]|nr:hemolysin III family protein [Polyangia bacterium]
MSTGPCLIRAIPGFFEPISSLSHLAAAAVGLVGAIPLVRHGRGSRGRFASVLVYAFSVVAMLTISGTYHALQGGGAARHTWRRLDYSAIWLLIAGTFTAIHGVMHQGRWRSWMLVAIWTLAVSCGLLQALRFDLFSGPAGLLLYLGLGWVGVLSIIKLGRQLGFLTVWPMWAAGLVYSAGAILEACRRPTLIAGWVGPHEVFHLAVITGIALHWAFIRQVVTVFAPSPALAGVTSLAPRPPPADADLRG